MRFQLAQHNMLEQVENATNSKKNKDEKENFIKETKINYKFKNDAFLVV